MSCNTKKENDNNTMNNTMNNDNIKVSEAGKNKNFTNSFAICMDMPAKLLIFRKNATIFNVYMEAAINSKTPLNEDYFFSKRLHIIKFNSFGYLTFAIDILFDKEQLIPLPLKIKNDRTILFVKENGVFVETTSNDLCQKIAAMNALTYEHDFKFYIYDKDENEFLEKTIDRIIYSTFQYNSSNNCIEIQTDNNESRNRYVEKLQSNGTWSE